MINLKPTERGFLRGEFDDAYGERCSIQESSIADYSAIWLGTNVERMHLTKEHVKALIPLLQFFVEYGELPR